MSKAKTVVDLMENGKRLFQKHDFINAASFFEQVIKIAPSNVESYEYLSVSRIYQNKPKEAKELLLHSISLDPNRTDPYKHLAMIAEVTDNRISEAENLYKKALLIEPQSVELLDLVASFYQRCGNASKTLEYREKILELNPDDPSSAYNVAILIQESNPERYFDLLYSIVKNSGIYRAEIIAMAHYNLGVLFNSKGELRKAIDHYQKALELNNQHTDVYHNLILTYREAGEYELAIKYSLELSNKQPLDYKKYYFMGLDYEHLGQLKQSNDCYIKALELEPDSYNSYDIYMRIGKNHFFAGKRNFGSGEKTTFLKENGEKEEVSDENMGRWSNYSFGNRLEDMDDPKNAINYYQQAYKAAPDIQRKIYALSNIALCYNVLGKLEFQKEIWIHIRKLDPKDTISLYNLARIHTRQELYEQAEENLKDIKKIDPDFIHLNYGYGFLYDHKEDHEKAIYYFKKQLERTPNFVLAMVSLGYCYLQANNLLLAFIWTGKASLIDRHNSNITKNLIDICGKISEQGINPSWESRKLDENEIQEILDFVSNNDIEFKPKNSEGWLKKLFNWLPEPVENKIFDFLIVSNSTPELLNSSNWYKKFLRIFPNSADLFNKLGVEYFRNGKYRGARLLFKKAIKIDNSFPDAHYNLGITHYINNHLDKAEQAFLKYQSYTKYYADMDNSWINNKDFFYDSVFVDGLISLSREDNEEAIEAFSCVIEKYGDFAELLWLRSEAYLKSGNKEKSRSDMEVACNLNPSVKLKKVTIRSQRSRVSTTHNDIKKLGVLMMEKATSSNKVVNLKDVRKAKSLGANLNDHKAS